MKTPRQFFLLLTAIYLLPTAAFSQPFSGKLVYTIEVSGSDSTLVELTKAFAGSSVTIYTSPQQFLMRENFSTGERESAIDHSTKQAYILSSGEKHTAQYYNIDDSKAELQDFMPYHFRTDMEYTGKTEKILGHTCKKYHILLSGFVNEGADAYVWIAEDIEMPSLRYKIEAEYVAVNAPAPLSIPVEKGFIMKYSGSETNTNVTYTLTALEKGAKP